LETIILTIGIEKMLTPRRCKIKTKRRKRDFIATMVVVGVAMIYTMVDPSTGVCVVGGMTLFQVQWEVEWWNDGGFFERILREDEKSRKIK